MNIDATGVTDAALLRVWQSLPERERNLVYRYASRLSESRDTQSAAQPDRSCSVIAELKRIAKAHPRVERHRVMGEAARLLAEHQLEGRPAQSVVAELESLFAAEAARAGGNA